jgi:SagB-type dehydrogenase family enzyme
MKLEVQRIAAQWMGEAFATGNDLVLPARPRLLSELVHVPLADGVLYVGGEHSQVLRGRGARSVLERIGSLLDGTRTLGEIADVVPEMSTEQVRDAVSLMFSRGLLEDGAPVPREGLLGEVARFLARFIDVSRANNNRDQALGRLATTAVGVIGPPGLLERAAAVLTDTGFGEVRRGADDGDVNLVISTGEAPRAARSGRCSLLLRLGANEVHLGPMLVPGVTACPACFARTHPHPRGESSASSAAYWVGAAVTQLTLLVSQIVISGTPRAFLVYHMTGSEFERSMRVAVPLPGCEACGLAGPPVAPDDPALVPWIYHSATALPGREFVAPRMHQNHYKVGNIELTRKLLPPLLGAPVIALPDPVQLDVPPPWAARSSACDCVPGLEAIATLLARTAGFVQGGAGPRRVAPTGGNLGSVELWVVARRADGLKPGIYHYDAPRHQLEVIAGEVDDVQLAAALRSTELPDCAIVTTGALARSALKYGRFCYRLVYLDSGVALAYLRAVAVAQRIAVHEVDTIDELATAELLGLSARFESPIPTAAIGLGAWQACEPPRQAEVPVLPRLAPDDFGDEILSRLLADSLVPPRLAALPSRAYAAAPIWRVVPPLETIVLGRRAVRAWSAAPLSGEIVRQLVAEVDAYLGARVASGAPPCFVRPVLGLARDAGSVVRGLYELSSGSELARIGDFGLAAMRACTNQEGLALSPAVIIMVANLAAAVEQRGARGYREAVQHAGAAIGHAWLVATGAGLGGTAAGGVLIGGLRAVAGFDPRQRCPLLAFHFGWPSRSAEVSA